MPYSNNAQPNAGIIFRTYLMYAAGLLLLAVLLTVLPALLTNTFTYNRWDNFEYYTPIIQWAHGLLAEGSFPRANLHQHLGEPFATNIQAGIYYPIYFLSATLHQWLDLPDQNLMGIILVLNLFIGISGFLCLSMQCGVPLPLALGLAVTSQAGAYSAAYSGVWIVVASIGAWLPWCGLGLLMLYRNNHWGGLFFSLALGLIGHCGHPQFWLYALVFFSVLVIIWGINNIRFLIRCTPYFLAGILLSLPTMLPIGLFKNETLRSENISLDAFLALSASWTSALGFITPLIQFPSSPLSDAKVSIFTYQGPLAAALLIFAILFPCRRNMKALLLSGFVTTLIFYLLAVGENFFLYPLTYGLPIWSSFRWPHKFLLFVQFGIGLVSAIGLRQLLDNKAKAKTLVISAASILILIWLALLLDESIRSPVLPSAPSVFILVTALLVLALLPGLHHPRVQWLVFSLSIVSSVSYNALIHDINLKNYPETNLKSDYGFTNDYRVATISRDYAQYPFRLGPLNLCMAATANGYFSFTGCTHPIVSRRFREKVPSEIFGDVPVEWANEYAATNFYDFFGVRYILASTAEDRRLLENTGKYSIDRIVGDVSIYKSQTALPLVFFATRTTKKSDWDADPRIVSADRLETKTWESGKLSYSSFDNNGDINLRGDTHGESLLILSNLYSPGWKVSVNDAPFKTPHIINDVVQGAVLPPGNFKVLFRYFPPGRWEGLIAGAFGTFILLLLLWKNTMVQPTKSMKDESG